MELYIEPKWAKTGRTKTERKPHPLTGKHQWITDDPKERENMIEGLRKGWRSPKNKKGRVSRSRIPVSVYDLDGNYVTTCLHINEAAERFGNGSTGNVWHCINRRRDRVGQYQFRKANVVEFQGQKLVKKTPIEPYKRKSRWSK